MSLVVGGGPEAEEELTRALVRAAQQPLRKLFSLLTWDGTCAKVLARLSPVLFLGHSST